LEKYFSHVLIASFSQSAISTIFFNAKCYKECIADWQADVGVKLSVKQTDESGFKIIFRKMLKFAGFLGVAHFLGIQWSALRVCKRSEMDSYSQHECFELLSLHKPTACLG
jgi:hypothetical protein